MNKTIRIGTNENTLSVLQAKFVESLIKPSGYQTEIISADSRQVFKELNIGVARTVLKKKATLKLSVRDIFHTQVMEGNTDFQYADEYFIIRRDSRVITLSFTWRFGKPLKTIKRSSGAEDEIERVNG